MNMLDGTKETGTMRGKDGWKKYIIGLNKVILLKIELMIYVEELL